MMDLVHFNQTCLFVVWKKFEAGIRSSHLALEAEDGDRQTHHSCDPQTQNHWFGVVKAGGREGSHIQCRVFYPEKVWMSWNQRVSVHHNMIYLDTNPIMKAMLKVWGEKYRKITTGWLYV